MIFIYLCATELKVFRRIVGEKMIISYGNNVIRCQEIYFVSSVSASINENHFEETELRRTTVLTQHTVLNYRYNVTKYYLRTFAAIEYE